MYKKNTIQSMNTKTRDEKCTECVTMRKKMKELGLDTLQECQILYTAMNRFIKTDQGESGSVQLPELDKILIYKLASRKGVESTIKISNKP